MDYNQGFPFELYWTANKVKLQFFEIESDDFLFWNHYLDMQLFQVDLEFFENYSYSGWFWLEHAVVF